ncbi:IgGFc-binding protein, partial [Polaribacter sp.]|uniref:IgGFc-binding protein n=1 Tax=Polaribacter sp. TaxID=1920175 RepID=UPI003F6BCFD1
MKYKLIILVFAILQFHNCYGQLSKKHYLPPLTYAEEGNANPENQYFYISTPSTKDVSYTIKQIGFPDNDITGIVSKNNPQERFIANGDSQLFVDSRQTSVVHNNKGYIVEATDVIYVSIRVLAGNGAQAGALVSKGSSALGTTFRAGMFTNENPQTNYLNFISVMASEDNTQITFDDLPTGIQIKNYTGSLPISFTLNEGESTIIATNATDNVINRDGLIGTLISADKPIAVNTGSANGSFHNGGGRDYGIDQIVGLDKVGTNYIFVKGGGENGWENVLIVAHEDNTAVSRDGNGSGIIASLNKGEYILLEGSEFNSNGNLYIETTKPVFAYQGVGASTSEANQGMFFVPPLSCESRGKVDNIPIIESIGNVTFSGGVTVVTNSNATVTINSEPIANFTTSGPFAIDINNDGVSDYETYKVTNLTGNISVESSEELYCAYFNVNGAATSGSFYSGFPTAPEINFNTTITSLGNCIPNITLQAANTDLFDSFEWQYFNETTNTWEARSTNTDYKPIESEPGRYKLIGTVDCTGAKFESIEIPVSICPDDYDGDLIIDNLDVDLDNDGILNCDESIGNAAINMSDISNPEIIFQDGSTNAALVSSTYTKTENTSSITGDADGNFESILASNPNSSAQYQLKFTNNVNFVLKQDPTKNHVSIDNQEFFVLKITPNNKNITLLDPDDQLLVDSNFDGEYETGVTTISASEIRFTYKAGVMGNSSTFQFVANQINEIIFEHNSIGLMTDSYFRGNIQLTCFSLDSDGDGIENIFDLDSDNDGIPDVNEAFPQPSSLSGVDANQDGLDDMFDGILNVDSDSDGILNYLDLDSDNDGIFDATEAGHNLDTNFDGIIDNANALIGKNGLVDNLEATPDAKNLSLNYTILNTDNDTDFDFVELDADNDNCFDVTEAGFTDLNNDGILDASPFTINDVGQVTNNLDGYTNPNLDYITSAPIILNTPFEDVTFCENETNSITIDSTADTFQWQLSTDGTTWNAISDNAVYSGSTTSSLQITNTLLSYNNYQYRVVLNKSGNACTETSNAINLSVNPMPILKAIPELNQCIEVTDSDTTVNLTLAQQNISETPNVTFEFYEDAAGTFLISNPTSYPVKVNVPETIYVKVISEFNCASELAELTINVGQTVRNAFNTLQPPVCDDFLDTNGNDTDANSDTDNITNFSLDKDAILNSINSPV